MNYHNLKFTVKGYLRCLILARMCIHLIIDIYKSRECRSTFRSVRYEKFVRINHREKLECLQN